MRGFATKKSFRLFLGRLVSFASILIIVLLTGISVKYLAMEHPWLPVLYVVSSLSVLGLALFMAIHPLARRTSLDQVALTVQEGHPELGDDLVNAVQIYRQFRPLNKAPGISERLSAALINRCAERLNRIDLRPLLRKPELRPSLITFLILLTAMGAVSLSDPTPLSYSLNLLLHPGAAAEYGRVTLDVKPGSVTLLKGSEVLIEAIYSGPFQADTWLDIGRETRHQMAPGEKGSYRFRLDKVTESISYSVRSRLAKSDLFHLNVVEPPLVGKLRVGLIPPSYTGLQSRTQEDNGNIIAYPGTEASFSVTPTGEVVEAALIFDDQKPVPLTRKEDGSWQGRTVLISQRNYRVELKDSLGFTNPRPISYPIKIISDRQPQVEIVSPARNLEMSEGEELTITYVGKDDFGVSAIYLRYTPENGEQKSLKIAGRSPAERGVSGQYDWHLSGPEFSHGRLITYYLEAVDNDTISGPHGGVSRTYTVKIRGREEEHKRVQDKIAAIAEDLLWLLGDQLEQQDEISRVIASPDEGAKSTIFARGRERKREFQEWLSKIAREVGATLAEMRRDPMSSYLTYFELQTLQGNLDYLARNTVEKSMQALGRAAAEGGREGAEDLLRLEERITGGLEQAVLLAEGAGKKSKAADLANISSDMLEEQGDLMDMLSRFLETGDQEAMDKFMGQMAGLQEMLAEFMEKLMELAQTPPGEFLNLESLPTLDLGQLQKLMQQLQDAVRQGDMEKALELAKRFMESLSKLVAMLQEMSSVAGGRFQGFQKTTHTVVDELGKMIEEQKRVLVATESVHGNMTRRLHRLQLDKRDEINRSVQSELGQFFKTLDMQIREGLKRGEIDREDYTGYNLLRRRINKLLDDLNQGDASGFLEAVRGFTAELEEMTERLSARASQEYGAQRNAGQGGTLKQYLANLNRLARELRSLGPGPQHLTGEERFGLKELSLKQNALRKDTDRLATFIQALSRLIPTLLPEIADNLWEAHSHMDQAAGQLYNGNSGMALPAEREALYFLKKSMDKLKEAARQLSAAASLSGMPMPLLMGQGAPLPLWFGLMPGIGYTEGGRLGQSLRPFKIPSGEDYQVPRLLREEVLKALKEGYPSEYREEVRKYFRNLSE